MTAEIRVRFFASLREAVGRAELAIDASATGNDVVDLDALFRHLKCELDPATLARLRSPAVRVAVNRTLVEGNTALRAGDEVAFLPPVTGG
jgi:molybdopterin converting factor subunit 1